MKFLKGLGTVVCSFLFFLALSIFSVAFMLHSTALSADFVKKQVNKIDISSVAHDIAEKQIGKELPADAAILKEVAYNVISEQEPWIKQQLTNGVDTTYDFFLGKSSTLVIMVPLVDLKTSLTADLWDASKKYLQQQLSGMNDSQVSSYLQDFMKQIPEDILPPELASLSPDLRNIAIEEYLREFSGQKSLVNVPPEVSGLIDTQVKQYFDAYLAEFTGQIPDSYTVPIDSNTMDSFFTIRKYIGYFQAGYYWLIAFMVVMAGLIFLINRDAKVTTRALGIDLLVFGVLDVAGSIIVKSISPMKFVQDTSQIPVSVQNIITNVYKDVASIALTFSIGILAAGVVLLLVSFFVPTRRAEG